jgi:hypothetical protein
MTTGPTMISTPPICRAATVTSTRAPENARMTTRTKTSKRGPRKETESATGGTAAAPMPPRPMIPAQSEPLAADDARRRDHRHDAKESRAGREPAR